MIGDISLAANIYIVTGYTDMRKSIDGLCAIVVEQLKQDPNGHSIYLFCGKRCDRIKVLLREPDGFVLLYKRLDVVQGRYRWPRNKSEVKSITWQQFDWLMYIATTYACPECKDTEEPQFIKDNGRPALISGSYASESLLAYILYRKYGLYIPLYRQEQDFLQMSAPISRTSMAHWIITAGQEYMQPMYDYFHRKLLKRRFLMMDELCEASHNSSYEKLCIM